jgi:hypothetical protein
VGAWNGDSGIFGGVAVVSLPGSNHSIDALAVDNTNVYWTDINDGWVMSCAKAGCDNATVLADGQDGPYGIAVDATNIYWTNFNGGQVLECPIGGCGGVPTVLASGQTDPTFIVSDGTNVYWANSGTIGCGEWNGCSGPMVSSAGGQVVRCAVGGCAGVPTVLALDSNDPSGIAVDDTNVYWADFISGNVLTCAIGGCGGEPIVLASAQTAPFGVAVDGANVYWTNWGSDWSTAQTAPATLMACAKGGCGGAPKTLSTGQTGRAYGITTDGVAVYWTDSREVMKVPVEGSDAGTTVIAVGYTPGFIAADKADVYWSNDTFAFIMKTPK